MDRHGQHVALPIEDLLRAVAVMRVHVEDRDPRTPIRETLRGDGCVVEIAKARRAVGAGVVPGRAAQRIGKARAVRDRRRARDGRFGRTQRRYPAVRPDRHRKVAQIPAKLAQEPGRGAGRADLLIGPPAPIRKGRGPGFRPPLGGQGLPVVPRRLQERDVVGRVDGVDRVETAGRRHRRLDPAPAQRGQQLLGPGGQVLWRHHPAEAHVLLRIVQRLIGVVEGLHHARAPCLVVVPDRRINSRVRRTGRRCCRRRCRPTRAPSVRSRRRG